MTNPRVYLPGHPKTFDRDPVTHELINVDQEASVALRNRVMPTEKEVEVILKRADKLKGEYFQKRAKAIVGLVKVFGKRRIELGLLEMADISVENGIMFITFTIAKKHKKGLFQYFEFLRKQGKPELLNKTLPVLQEEYKAWAKTFEGYRLKKYRRPKQTPLTDKYAKLIYEYYLLMKTMYPTSKFVFPRGKSIFGETYIINGDFGLSGRHLLRIFKEIDPSGWLHLYRKLKGSQVARQFGRTLESINEVKSTLDLERPETAMRYIEEFVPKMEKGEPEA